MLALNSSACMESLTNWRSFSILIMPIFLLQVQNYTLPLSLLSSRTHIVNNYPGFDPYRMSIERRY